MPRRKINKVKGKDKEKQNVQRRLMEISFRVDDYVYKNNPLTVVEAQTYYQEITVLFLQCHQDRRLLQVIEKLTRVMRQIIVENAGNYPNFDTNEQQKQTCDMVTMTRSIQETDLCEENYNTIAENNITKPVDESNEDIALISRAVSNISVRDIESQSILNNDESLIQLNDVDTCGQGLEEYDKMISATCLANKMMDTHSPAIENNTVSINMNDAVNEIRDNIPTTLEDTLLSNKSQPNIDENIPKTNAIKNRRTLSEENVSGLTALKDNQNNKITKTKKVKKNAKFKPPSKITTTANKDNIDNSFDGNKDAKKNVKNKNKIINQETKLRKDVKDARRKPSYETDMSWVENIKYVRKVDNEEFKHNMNISESFWDTCEFPSDLNVTDFKY